MAKQIEADYLVIGAGASGMAFVDTLLSETDATVIMVDKQHKPGGHWLDAYSFVTLHQPSAFYGVSSKELSRGIKDKVGLNKGLNELASGVEVQAYYDDLMRETFIPSGRVQYFPMSEYRQDGCIHSLMTGEVVNVTYRHKRIDSTYYKTSIPATHTPAFSVDDRVRFIPPNALPKIATPVEGYTIIGGGKTGIDTCLWLLEQGINPADIAWIMPRDAWLIDRQNTQPTDEFFLDVMGAQAAQMEAIAQSTSIDDMFLRLEQAGVFMRIDTDVMPQMFHGSTVSRLELAELRKIKNIVRLGRVTHLGSSEIELTHGTIPTSEQRVHVDCTASAITNLATKDVFSEDTITLQTVRAYQPAFSAAFIAHIEATYDDIDKKNRLTQVVPLPNTTDDWVELTYKNMMNQYFWGKEPGLKKWLLNNRLDGFMHMVKNVRFYQLDKIKVLNRMRISAKPAIEKLKEYRAQLKSKTP